jgi:hypothetical protein
MPIDRSQGRTVHIYDVNDPEVVLAGLILSNGVTNVSFYRMVEILFVFESTFYLQTRDSIVVERNDHALLPGSYDIISDRKFRILNPSYVS